MKKPRRKKFKVLLHRSYVVEVSATDEKNAKELTEFFVGNPSDLSSSTERKKLKFNIESLEMVNNTAPEILP